MRLPTLIKPRLKVIRDGCGSPYLIRLTLFTIFGYSLKLHVFLRGDEDRELHDHPWGFWTWLIVGEYFEEVPWSQVSENHHKFNLLPPPGKPDLALITQGNDDNVHVFIHRKAGDLDYRPPEWRHRVTIQNPVVTIVLTRGKVREWGFWTVKGWIPWTKFVSNRDC